MGNRSLHLPGLSTPIQAQDLLFHLQANVEHLVQKMKTTVKRGLVLRYLIYGLFLTEERIDSWLGH